MIILDDFILRQTIDDVALTFGNVFTQDKSFPQLNSAESTESIEFAENCSL